LRIFIENLPKIIPLSNPPENPPETGSGSAWVCYESSTVGQKSAWVPPKITPPAFSAQTHQRSGPLSLPSISLSLDLSLSLSLCMSLSLLDLSLSLNLFLSLSLSLSPGLILPHRFPHLSVCSLSALCVCLGETDRGSEEEENKRKREGEKKE